MLKKRRWPGSRSGFIRVHFFSADPGSRTKLNGSKALQFKSTLDCLPGSLVLNLQQASPQPILNII